MYSIKQAADIAGISVRTLHHYDQIGLLAPSGRTQSGYRQYSEEDLALLAQITLLKELQKQSTQKRCAENSLKTS